MKWRTCTTLILLSAAAAAWSDEGDKDPRTGEARDILSKAAAAMKEVKRVGYRAEYFGTEWVVEYVPKVQGEVVVGQQSKYDIVEFFCRVTIQPHDSEESFEYTAGCDGDSYFIIDPKTRKAHKDIDPAVLGSQGRNLQRAVLQAFAEPEPLKDQMEAEKIELDGSETIDGHDCHKILIEDGEGPKTALFVSKRDFLPRRIVRTYTNPQGEPGSTQLTLMSLVTNPKEPQDPFELHLPDGYTLTDDFAP